MQPVGGALLVGDFKLVTSPSKSVCFGDRSAPAFLNKSGKKHSSLRAELPRPPGHSTNASHGLQGQRQGSVLRGLEPRLQGRVGAGS